MTYKQALYDLKNRLEKMYTLNKEEILKLHPIMYKEHPLCIANVTYSRGDCELCPATKVCIGDSRARSQYEQNDISKSKFLQEFKKFIHNFEKKLRKLA